MELFTSNSTDQVKLDDLVGDGKQYKDVEALAKAVVHKEAFIEQLKAEKAEAVQELATRAAVEEAIKTLQRQSNANGTQTSQTVTNGTQTQTTENNANLTLEAVEKLLETKEAQKRQTQNLSIVSEAVIKYAGTKEKGAEFLDTRAKELGISKDRLTEIGKESPSALLKILGVDEKKVNTPISPTEKSLTVASQRQSEKPFDLSGAMTKEDYTNLRRTDPSLYFSPAVQNKLMKDRMEERRKQLMK